MFLAILWRASEYVTESELLAAGLCPNNGESLCGYGIAVQLSHTPGEVGPTNNRVTGICNAAIAFRLVDRTHVHARKTSLNGTKRLHELMIEVAQSSGQFARTIERALMIPEIPAAASSALTRGENNG